MKAKKDIERIGEISNLLLKVQFRTTLALALLTMVWSAGAALVAAGIVLMFLSNGGIEGVIVTVGGLCIWFLGTRDAIEAAKKLGVQE